MDDGKARKRKVYPDIGGGFLVRRAGVVYRPTKYEIRNANDEKRLERCFIEIQLDALAEAWLPAGA
ncbi:MAG: hypothetical protein Q8S00_31080 [Deltaproteobacteria bacterium]|nr:hypothetical protein [Deltaproteobacteria bacterium]MDZ4344082.1 hypothetical protein [Candidatus Binatia bacterium]